MAYSVILDPGFIYRLDCTSFFFNYLWLVLQPFLFFLGICSFPGAIDFPRTSKVVFLDR